MAEKKTLVNFKVKYHGVFELEKVVKTIRGFLGAGNYKVVEPSYKHKLGGDGANVEVKINSFREETQHVKYQVNAVIRASDLQDVEVVKEGEKQKKQQGDVEIEVEGIMELDYENKFEKPGFMQGVRNWYHTYALNGKISGYKAHLRTKLIKLRQEIYSSLDFEARK
jgi:hypothetical protein